MRDGRLVVRILGVVSTTHGFAYAATESADRLVLWDNRRVSKSRAAVRQALDVMLRKTRPLFVATEPLEQSEKRQRGYSFDEELTFACSQRDIKILRIARADLEHHLRLANSLKWTIAQAIASRFEILAERLPKARRGWDSEDDRIGLFLALARAVAAWMEFQKPRNKSPSPKSPTSM